MNFKLKKPPFYFYIILWIVALALGLQLDKKIQNLSDLFGLVVLIMPITFAYIWVLRNKIKIFKYYKKIRKKFKHVFYTIESVICIFIISVLISIFSLGGYTNFKERIVYEYISINERNESCAKSYWTFMGDTVYSRYYWKKNTQFLEYYKYKPYKFIKKINALKNESLFEFNACVAIGHALKAAHKGNKVAKEFLASMPGEMGWEFSYGFNSSLFLHRLFFFIEGEQQADDFFNLRYVSELDENKLYNPALLNAYSYKDLKNKQKARKYNKLAAEEGYLQGMEDYLYSLSDEEKINKNECQFILKYSDYLANENSILHSINIAYSKIGRLTDHSKHLYECNEKKTNFAGGIEIFKNVIEKIKDPKPSSNFLTTYPALIYLNGWGNVDKNKKLAMELFNKNLDSKSPSELSRAYLLLNDLNNYKNDLKLLNEILVSEVTIYKPKRYIVCNNVKYDFKIPKVDKENKQQKQSRKLKYLEPLKTCLDNASREQRIESVKSYIKSWIENWFNNPEFVKTLNLYG